MTQRFYTEIQSYFQMSWIVLNRDVLKFIHCGPLALCTCSGCTQRRLSHYPPAEAPQPHLQHSHKQKQLLWKSESRNSSFTELGNSSCSGTRINSPVTPSGRMVYSLSVKPFSRAWALMFLLKMSLPVKYRTPQ